MKTFKRFILDIKKYRAYVVQSAKSQLKTEVAGSYLNFLWWILDPIALMLTYTFVFGFVFGKTEDYFPAFVFTGLTLWNFFSGNVKHAVRLIRRSKSVISKIYLPKTMLLLTQMLVYGFKMMICYVLIFVMMFIFKVPFNWHIIISIPIMLLLFLLTFGVSCFFMNFGVYVEDLANVTDIVMKLLFYMTGILFDIDIRIGKNYPVLAHILGKANPMALLLKSMRNVMLYSTDPNWKWLGIWLLISIVLVFFGVMLVYKNENNYVKGI